MHNEFFFLIKTFAAVYIWQFYTTVLQQFTCSFWVAVAVAVTVAVAVAVTVTVAAFRRLVTD
jgi:hypothetical protein